MTRTRIAFQGDHGAFSDEASRQFMPECETMPCETFEMALNAVRQGHAAYAAIPVDNSIAGRVADVHRLLPESDLHIIGEYYLPIRQCLMGVGSLKDVRDVYSHIHALDQCRDFIKKHDLSRHDFKDTAASARMVSEKGDPTKAAIGSPYAAEFYGLDILEADIQDEPLNYTRFWLFSPKPVTPEFKTDSAYKTTLIFRTKNIPAALYKTQGGFATNEINMSRIESLSSQMFGDNAAFCVDIDTHPDDPACKRALDELAFHCEEGSVKILGVYPYNKPDIDVNRAIQPDQSLVKAKKPL